MKPLLSILAITALAYGGYELSQREPQPAPVKPVEQQLASYVSPELLKTGDTSDVTIRFRLNEANQIASVRVEGTNQQLNTQLAHELKGKTLAGADLDAQSTYKALFRVKAA